MELKQFGKVNKSHIVKIIVWHFFTFVDHLTWEQNYNFQILR
jgi:hypothetical protein